MAFDNTEPNSGHSLRSCAPHLLANFEALETALAREHEFSTGGTTADQAHHKKGSARCFIQDSAPSTRRDTTAFTAEDNGSLWIDTNSSPDNQFNVLTDYSVPTWTPVSAEIIAALLASARTFAAAVTFDVAAILSKAPTLTEGIVANNSYLQARNTAGNGNVDLIKADGSDVPTVPDDTANATSGAPTADASLANKKYVDDHKWQTDGSTVFNTSMTAANTFQDLDLSAKVGSNDALVFLEVSGTTDWFAVKPKGYGSTFSHHKASGPSCVDFDVAVDYAYFTVATDSSGVIQIASDSDSRTFTIKLIGYVK